MRSLKIFFLAACLLLTAQQASAADYVVDTNHSEVMFKVAHLGISSVTGRFQEFEGEFSYDPENVTASTASAVVQAHSVDTNQKKRDEHLRSCDFFCVEKYETISFKAKEVKPVTASSFTVIGDLTMHGVTKEIALVSEFQGEAVGPSGDKRVGFSATGQINRKDFGLKWNDLTETGGILVGDEVTITLNMQGVEKKKEQKEE